MTGRLRVAKIAPIPGAGQSRILFDPPRPDPSIFTKLPLSRVFIYKPLFLSCISLSSSLFFFAFLSYRPPLPHIALFLTQPPSSHSPLPHTGSISLVVLKPSLNLAVRHRHLRWWLLSIQPKSNEHHFLSSVRSHCSLSSRTVIKLLALAMKTNDHCHLLRQIFRQFLCDLGQILVFGTIPYRDLEIKFMSETWCDLDL